MANDNDTSAYKKLLLHFMGELDPLYSMLQWLTERMMEALLTGPSPSGTQGGWDGRRMTSARTGSPSGGSSACRCRRTDTRRPCPRGSP